MVEAAVTHHDRQAALEAMDREMVRLHNEEGLSLQDIGVIFPHNGKPRSKEGVRIALRRAANRGEKVLPSRGKSRGHVNKHTERAEARAREARRLFSEGMPEDEIGAALGVCGKTLRGYLEDLPEYGEARRQARRRPVKATLSYGEILRLREDESWKIREISEAAGITPSRVSQILQRQGLYEPTPDTAARIETVLDLLSDGVPVSGVAARIGRSPSQVYAYRSLGEALGLGRAGQGE